MAQKRFLTLDALRGIAAALVVTMHFGAQFGGFTPRFGYLAVDLFFALSGFVIAYSYDDRFSNDEMSIQKFVTRRLERLAPLYFCGLLIGLLSQLIARDPKMEGWRLPVAFAFNALGLPSPIEGAAGGYTPLNGTFWSLFLELWVANLFYALTFRWLRRTWLGGLIAVCGGGLAILRISLRLIGRRLASKASRSWPAPGRLFIQHRRRPLPTL